MRVSACNSVQPLKMAPITAADGPVAVTGCAGFIGSHVVLNLVEHVSTL